mgnify:CR=1 FL=1
MQDVQRKEQDAQQNVQDVLQEESVQEDAVGEEELHAEDAEKFAESDSKHAKVN